MRCINETAKLPGYKTGLHPTFFSSPTDFTVLFRNVNYGMKQDDDQADTQDNEKSTQDKILAFCAEARSKTEIVEHFGLKSAKSLTEHHLHPLLASGRLEMTIPDKPTSRNQKYRTVRD